MKRMAIVAAVLALLVVGFLPAAATATDGALKETADFKLMVPAGWEFSDFGNGALQTYNKSGSYMVELKKAGNNMTEKDVETGVAAIAKQYSGSGPDKVDMLGLTFYTTTFDRSSTHQTLYAALKDGVKISINLVGADHETEPTIQGVFKSIELK